MKRYEVNITANVPYPLSKRYTMACGSFNVAVARAIKLYRKDVPGKRINHMGIQVDQVTVNLNIE